MTMNTTETTDTTETSYRGGEAMGRFTELDQWAASPEMGLRVNKLGYELAMWLSAWKDVRNAYDVKVCYQHPVNCCLQLRSDER